VYIPCKEDYSENCRPTKNSYLKQLNERHAHENQTGEETTKEAHFSTIFHVNVTEVMLVQQADHLSRRKNRCILKNVLLGNSKLAQQTCEEVCRMSWSEARIL